MSEKKSQGLEPDLVRELASILRASDLTEIEVEHGGLKLRLARTITVAAVPAAYGPAPVAAAPAFAAPAPAATPEPASLEGAVPSPMVGTAYLSPEPGAAMFIKVGDTVKEGQTLMIVEAMKTFNPIPAPRGGTIAQILVSDGQPVEYGQALVVLS